jgi:hypothetical protein
MQVKSVRCLTLVASVAFAACGDSTDLVMGELSEAEAQELAEALLMTTFSSTGDVPQPATGGPQTAPFQFSQDVEGEFACPLGGAVGYEASIEISGDTESEAGTLSYEMTQVHEACVVASASEQLFTLTGSPSLTLEFQVDNDGQGAVEWGGSVQGAVAWVTDDRSGTCAASFEFSGHQSGAESVSGAMSGTLCGHGIEQQFSIG